MNKQTKLWLTTVWVIVVAGLLALAACSGSDAPAAFAPLGDGGSSGSAKGDANAKDHPPPRPIDEKPDATSPDDAPAPQLTSITPDKGALNSVGPTITVNGALFVPRSKILLDGVELQTSFESDTQLKATIPDDKMKAVAQLKVSVKTAEPGGGTSTEAVFAVENPKPVLTSLNPLSVKTGAGTTILTLTGMNFVAGAKVRFGTSDLPSNTKSDTSIEATISDQLLLASASIPVHVTNPFPGGGVTADLAFTVSDPQSSITSIACTSASQCPSPTSAFVNSTGFKLTVVGTGFVGTPKVLFNGTEVSTVTDASNQVTATIPANLLTAVGDVPVTVKTGGGISAAVAFSIVYPKPTVSSVTPTKIGAGSNPTEVTVTGTKFFTNSVIRFNGADAATTFVSDTSLKATLTAQQLALAGTITVNVFNSTPGGGQNTETNKISVENGLPKINAFQPAGVPAVASGGPDTPVDILGTGFVAGTTAKAVVGATFPSGGTGATTLGVTYVDSGHIQVAVPAALLKDQGTVVTMQLNNPAPGGGNSSTGAAVPRLQVLCDGTGVNVFVNTTVTETRTPDYTVPKISRWAAGGGTCPQDLITAEQQPANHVVVMNETTSDLLLTAWGVCPNAKGDGFLAFYTGGTEPADDTARKACTGRVSEGGLATPDSNGSPTCPGLMKDNGALRLKACERAVIELQAFQVENMSNPPPTLLRVKGEAP